MKVDHLFSDNGKIEEQFVCFAYQLDFLNDIWHLKSS
jgi:hypothetical protein